MYGRSYDLEPYNMVGRDAITLLLALVGIPLLAFPVVYHRRWAWSKVKFPEDLESYYLDFKTLWPSLCPPVEDRRYEALLLGGILTLVGLARAITLYDSLLLRNILSRLAARTGDFPQQSIIIFGFLHCFARAMVTWLQWNLTRKLENQLVDRLNLAIHNKVISLSADYHDNKESSILFGTMTSDGKRVTFFLTRVCFKMLPTALDMILAVYSFVVVCGARLGCIMVATLGAYTVIAMITTHDPPLTKEWQKTSERWRTLASNVTTTWWTMMIFGRQEYEKHRFADAIDKHRDVDTRFCNSYWKSYHLKHIPEGIGMVILGIMISREIWADATRGPGDFAMLIHLWQNIISPSESVLRWNKDFSNFSVEIKRLVQTLQADITIKDVEGADDLVLSKGTIEVKDVSFTYPQKSRPAIMNFSFTVPGGQIIALVGRSGGGKSTFLKLLMRGYDPCGGQILIDGQDITKVRKKSLIDNIGLVPQTIGAFNETVLENLRYANLEASHEQCEAACRAVGLHEKIASFPKKYDEIIGEQGGRLSGGELQRLAIARALLKDSRIVLFDEATSNLDAATEDQIQGYLRKWYANKTVIIVAHRLTTVRHVDAIVAVRDGQIVETGTLDDLLRKGGYFYDLWEKQRLSPAGPSGSLSSSPSSSSPSLSTTSPVQTT